MKAVSISRLKFFPALAALAAVLVLGCGNDGGPTTGGTVAELAAQGWNRFSSGDYRGAVSKFNEAVARGGSDTEMAPVYDGLGWSYARMGMLQSSIDSFNYVRYTISLASQDTYAGGCIVHLAMRDYEDAAEWSGRIFEIYGNDYEYSFQHDPDVTDVTLRLVRAISKFHLGDYDSSYADVKLLGGPQDLSADDPDFVANLLEAIQDLREQYGQGLLNP